MRSATGRSSSSASSGILVPSPPRERPRARSSEPLSCGPPPLAGERADVRVQHQEEVLLVPDEAGENPLPHPGTDPAHEARMDVVLATALRQVVPARARTQYPQHRADEKPVVRRRPPHMLQTARKRVLDPLPLRRTPLIPTRCPHPSQSKRHDRAKTIWGYRLEPQDAPEIVPK